MKVEFSENKREPSEADWQSLKREALYWVGAVQTRRDERGGASNSYNHILNNLCGVLTPIVEVVDVSTERKNEWYHRAIATLGYIKKYFKLLEDFPDFAEKELKPGGGYFPEMMDQLTGAKESIDVYEEKLRGEVSLNKPAI